MALPNILQRLFQNDGKGPLLRQDILPAVQVSVLPGSVLAFNGTFGGSDGKRPIPKGSTKADESWALCDGSNGTPDLRDRFIVGAGTSYKAGTKGGAATQNVSAALSGSVGATTLSVAQMPSHNHRGQNTVDIPSSNRGDTYNIGIDDARTRFTSPTDNTGGSGSHTHTLSGSATGTVATIPPYYALAYIMKL